MGNKNVMKAGHLLTAVLAVASVAMTVSCSKGGDVPADGILRLRFEGMAAEAVSKVIREEMPDTNDFILEIVSGNTVIYKGLYGQSPEKVAVPAGNCTVSVRSEEFDGPAFASPLYGDDRCVVVPAGGVLDVSLVCTQLNSGIVLKTDPDFLTVDRDNWNGCVKCCQYQQIGDEQKDKLSVPDFLWFFHLDDTPFYCNQTSGNCHHIFMIAQKTASSISGCNCYQKQV